MEVRVLFVEDADHLPSSFGTSPKKEAPVCIVRHP